MLRLSLPRAVLLALPWLAAGTASPATQPQKPQVFGSEVSLVAIPVFVVDGKGRAWRGLTAEDFEVAEDGKKVTVVSFQDVDTTSAEDQERIRQASPARRRFLLLFDLSFTDPAGLHRARLAARDFVQRRLADSDLAAVATVDTNRGLRVVANFTEDRALLVSAVETLGVPALTRSSDPLSLSLALAADVQPGGSSRFDETSLAVTDTVMAVLARRMRAADEALYRRHVLALASSLADLGRGLRGVDGRKQVLYFSSGFDGSALVGQQGQDARDAAQAVTLGRLYDVDSDTRFGDSRLRDVLADVTRSLSASDAVVHAIDVTGLGSDMSLAQNVSRDFARDTSGRESLGYLASETGGRFYKDSNDLSVSLGEIGDMTSRYYILGYQPEKVAGPGRFHKIRVKVRRDGARVSHRAGYHEPVAREGQGPLQRQFEAAQLVMTGSGRNDLGFLVLCLPFPSLEDKQTLGVVIQVPRDQVRWAKDRPLALEVYAYAVAEDGAVAGHLAHLVRLDLSQGDPNSVARGLSFSGSLKLAPGRYTVRFMVQEPETGASGVQFMEVSIPSREPRAGFLLPPVVLDDPERWISAPLGSPSDASPLSVAGASLVPRTSFEVESGTTTTLALVAYASTRPANPEAGLAIQSSITDASGAQVSPGPMRILKVHREGARSTYLVSFKPEGLAPGTYTLRLGLGSGAERLESFSLLKVRAAS